MTKNNTHVDTFIDQLLHHFIVTSGLFKQRWMQSTLRLMLSPPFRRFAEIASSFDQSVANLGLPEASRQFLPTYINQPEIHGQENIPPDGPVLIISNHPGTLDSLLIASRMPRTDLKIVAKGYPFYLALSRLKDSFIFTSNEVHDRVAAIRQSIQQLQSGGMLLIFPRGLIEPDPAVMPGAEETLTEWSPSIELFLRKVPDARLLLTIVSGVMAPSSLRNPFMRLGRNPVERQTVAEFFQVIRHIYMPNSLRVSPKVTFDLPRTASDLLDQFGGSGIMQEIIQSARRLLYTHRSDK